MSNLPKDWLSARLGDVADVTSGIGFPKQYQGHTSGDLPFFKVGDISRSVELTEGSLLHAANYVSHSVAKQLKGKPVAAGSVAFAKIGEAIKLNRRALTVVPSLFDNNVMAVTPKDGLHPKYLFYFLRTADFSAAARATTVPSLRKGDVEDLVIPLAPLAEQKRIADKLHRLLAVVDACKARLDAIHVILKRFRQSVLAAATSGELTEEWREAAGLDGEWKTSTIAEVTSKVGSGATPRGGESAYKVKGVPLIRSMNVVFFGFKREGLAFIDEAQANDLRNVSVAGGDVLLNITGASIGRVTIAPADLAGARVNQHVSIIRPIPQLRSDFLCWFLASPKMQKIIGAENYGVTRQALTKQQILEFEVPVPPVAEQEEIASRVHVLFGFAGQIEGNARNARSRIEKLPPCLLSRAFAGELASDGP